jgi:hypothetical protein
MKPGGGTPSALIGRVTDQIGTRPGLAAREVAYRIGRVGRDSLLDRQYERITAARGLRFEPLPTTPLPAAEDLPAALEPAAQRVLAFAAGTAARRFDLLGSGPVEHGERIDWSLDPRSGFRWPPLPHRQVRAGTAAGADVKLPWELSRCHQFLALARARNLTGSPAHLQTLREHWAAWLDDNPPGVGVNWVNPMEVAIRAVNWAWALGELGGPDELGDPLGGRVVESLERHGRHLRWSLEGTPRLRSNHFLSNVLGLLVLGSTLRGAAPRRWRSFAAATLEREAGRQVGSDGVDFEASTSYHGLVLEIFLVARIAAARSGAPLSAGFDRRVRSMAAASAALRHPGGRMPRFGDADDGRILPLDEHREPTHDHLLFLAAATLGTAPPPGSREVGDAAFVAGPEAWPAILPAGGTDAPDRPAGCHAFEDAGLYVLGGRRSHLVLRCGGVGQNGNGGHAHNDLLSYELSVDGVPLIVDPGTLAYTGDPAARTVSRSTHSHGTVAIDGEEINPIDPARPFQLRGIATPRLERFDRTDETATLVCSHDGYHRLPSKAIHRREVALDRGSDRIRIVDRIDGTGAATAVSRLQLAPGVSIERVPDRDAPTGCTVLTLHRGTVGVRLLLSGDARVAEGLVANRYGVAEPAALLEVTYRGELPMTFEQEIRIDR